tara:strand:- start:243 stop:668 length:426 start_codon:yes stop_codon:yes gene_type:complete
MIAEDSDGFIAITIMLDRGDGRRNGRQQGGEFAGSVTSTEGFSGKTWQLLVEIIIKGRRVDKVKDERIVFFVGKRRRDDAIDKRVRSKSLVKGDRILTKEMELDTGFGEQRDMLDTKCTRTNGIGRKVRLFIADTKCHFID